jgi:uncharacterized protein (DUF1501 family)
VAPAFLVRTAQAAEKTRPEAGRVLVVVFLGGGNDGLNTVVPYKDPDYRRLRPGIHLSGAALHKIDDQLGLHPALGGWEKLLRAKRLAVVQGVGYPGADRSHFESSRVWHTARLDADPGTPGWLARGVEFGRPVGDARALYAGAPPLPQALTGGRFQLPAVDRPDRFLRRIGMPAGPGAKDQGAALDRLAADGEAAPGSLAEFVQSSSALSFESSARLESLRATPATGYPQSQFGRRLGFIADMIKAGLKTSVYYAVHGDGAYDTHSDQLQPHERLLQDLGDSTRAFVEDLDKAGAAGRVLVLVFSEFGRRVAENGGGTDHGKAGPVFLLGEPVKPGLHGPRPDLRNLDAGDLKAEVDFRRVYATVLDQWLGLPSEKVLGSKYDHLAVL